MDTMFPNPDGPGIWIATNSVGALAFAVLTVVVLLHGRQSRCFYWLLTASITTGLWFALLAIEPVTTLSAPILDVVEALRSASWLALAAALAGPFDRTATYRLLRLTLVAIPAALIGFLAWHALNSTVFGSAIAGHNIALAYGTLAIALCGLTLVEHAFRGSDIDSRWAIKYLCLGIATLLVYDFVIYAGALLTHRINIAEWNARGLVDALAAGMIAASVKRQSVRDGRIAMPRRALLRSTAFVLGGGYLLVVALGRYVIRNMGGNWSDVAAVVFVVAAVVGLSVLAFSGQARARIRILLGTYFFRYRYDYRDAWLALTAQLARTQDGLTPEQRAIQAVAGLFDSPAGALWMVRDQAYRCVCEWNLGDADQTVVAIDSSLATHLQRTDSVIRIDDSDGRDAATGSRTALPTWMARLPRAWFVLPLFGEDGLLGFMMLTRPRAPYRMTWEEIDLLKTVGRQVGVYLQQQENSRALSRARQFEAFNRLTAFLMHDLKNIANQQSLMLQNAARHKHDPAFIDDLIVTIEQSVERMNDLLARIRRGSDNRADAALVAVDDAVARAIAPLDARTPKPILVAGAGQETVHVDPRLFKTVVANLVRNAQDATPATGKVSVATRRQGEAVSIEVSDTGDGMSRAFVRDRLFEPFYSTKSSQGMGIGAYEAREFARDAGGDMDVDSTPGEGTTVTLSLLRHQANAQVDHAPWIHDQSEVSA